MSKTLSDRQLIAMIQSGGAAANLAVTELYQRQQVALTSFLAKRVPETMVADIFHDSILKLIENTQKGLFEGASSLKTYLYGIAKNLCYKYLEGCRKRAKDCTYFPSICSESNCPEHTLMEAEAKDFLDQAVGSISPQQGKIVQLWSQAYSMKEIAQTLGYQSEGVVRVTKMRSFRQLTNRIQSDDTLQRMYRELRA
ncbi:sigma-70 family RNA polymerase sigma factor [Pontibacter sp. G13]|uniref:RNA polymerase sigma factor n=1 Tax=Pontibacter sp. G13 TaxID=3074898 RepID=UPI00288ABE66|nr:sigma-70 family RNA polymerase sigma factor [Pontibacter sp. G13]WNJ17311.1 sigma-70 family RNA polymerase sigma factor [Pontibacter sp. G13]